MSGIRADSEIGRIIGTNLRRERERHGFTQQQFADLVGHSRSYIVQTENGYVKVPGAHAVYRWASALGVRMEDLMAVPRIEHLSKGRFRAKQEARQRLHTAREGVSLADAEDEAERRYAVMKAGAFEMPDDEDKETWLAGTGLVFDEVVEAGMRYARKYVGQASTEMVAAGGYMCGIVVGRLAGKLSTNLSQ